MKVSIVEDDAVQRQQLCEWLQDEDVITYDCGAKLTSALDEQEGRFMIVDWELPDAHGPELIRSLRERYDQAMPIIMLTARDSEADIIKGLESGADDYIIKPTSQHVLKARISAVSRRYQSATEESAIIEVGPYQIDASLREIRLNGELVKLSTKDFDLAHFFFTHINELVSREQLLQDLWGLNSHVSTRTLDTHVSRIRKSLQLNAANGYSVNTVYQHGYRMVASSNNA